MVETDDTRSKRSGSRESTVERASSVEEAYTTTSGEQQKQTLVQIPRVTARTIPGQANLQNQGAVDWGCHGLLAYGSNYSVVIIDTKNIQPIQCLDKHKSMVNKVKWEKDGNLGARPLHESAPCELASSDATGHIIIWDVALGTPKAVLQEGSKPVLDMEWIPQWNRQQHVVNNKSESGFMEKDRVPLYLASLHPPYCLVLWDVHAKSKIWKKTYTETLVSFSVDPFDAARIAFLCQDCILFAEDFTPSRVPSSNGRKFYISSPRAVQQQQQQQQLASSNPNLTSAGTEEKQGTRDRLRRLMKDLVVGETKPKPDDLMTASECLQLLYHSSLRHHLILVYPREALILDLHINQTVGIIPLEKTASPLAQVITARQRDVLFCLHDSGSISVKFRRRQAVAVTSPVDNPFDNALSYGGNSAPTTSESFLEVGYEQRCQSEPIRQTKGTKVLGMAINPVCERKIALFLTTGKVVLLEIRPKWQSHLQQEGVNSSAGISPWKIDLSADPKHKMRMFNPRYLDTLSELVPPLISSGLAVNRPSPPLRLVVSGLLSGLSGCSRMTAMRMCPPLTTRNWAQYSPIIAVGNAAGSVQIINVSTGALEKEYSLHSYPVRGIEWASLTTFISYAHLGNQSPSGSNLSSSLLGVGGSGSSSGSQGGVGSGVGSVGVGSGSGVSSSGGGGVGSGTGGGGGSGGGSGGSGLVRNELLLTEILSGTSTVLRGDRGDEPPIDMLRISPLKQYFVIIMQDGPFELWDLRSLCILRTMPKKFPLVTALEWSPIHNLKSLKKKLAHGEDKDTVDDSVSFGSAPTIAQNPATLLPTTTASFFPSASSSNTSLLTATTPSSDRGSSSSFGDADGSQSHASHQQQHLLVAREHFVFSDADSHLYHFSVEGNVVKDGIKIPSEHGVGMVTCIAFKSDIVVQGDFDGTLYVWDLKGRLSRNISTGRGQLKKIRFGPGKGNFKLLALFNDGVDLYDLKKQQNERISSLRCPRDMVRVLDVEWGASDKPVLATQDGCLRIVDTSLMITSSPLLEYSFQEPVFCPALLPTSDAQNLYLVLSNQSWRDKYSFEFSTRDGFSEDILPALADQLVMLSEGVVKTLKSGRLGTAERSLTVAQIFGESQDVEFWTVTLYYLQVAATSASTGDRFGNFLWDKKQSPERKPAAKGDGDTISIGSGSPRFSPHPWIEPLDSCFDFLCDPHTFQKMQLDRVTLHESKRGGGSSGGGPSKVGAGGPLRSNYEQTRKVVERLILLGETDRAVQLLLETEMDNPQYYSDAIKACLVATIQSTGTAQSTIKLVATNLIANGNVWEGVQLLCLIGKGIDACRYLISYGLWMDAVWLARAVLPPVPDAREVLSKWADHLWSTGNKSKAILVHVSLGHFDRVAELLLTLGLVIRAYLLVEACKEFSIPLPDHIVMAVKTSMLNHAFSLGNESLANIIGEEIKSQAHLHNQPNLLLEE